MADNRKQDSDKFQWKKMSKTLFFWILLLIGIMYVVNSYNSTKSKEVVIPYKEKFLQLLDAESIISATIIERTMHGKLKYPEIIMKDGREISFTTFKTILPPYDSDSDLLKRLDDKGVVYKFEERTTGWLGFLLPMLPWVLFIFLYLFLIKRMQGGGSKGIFSFGKSKAKLLSENISKVTFKDVAGADEAKEELSEIIEFLKSPDKFQALGGRIPKGVLLLGPPGTGKTLLGKAVAGEAGVPFYSISGADFVEMFVGVGASRVRDLFQQGKKNAPCIIFIDEIDAVGRRRGAGLGGGHDEREQTLNQLLVEMDGFETNEGVILIAATNRPDVLDQALLRPGRFDRQVVVDRPDVRGREGILKVHTKKIPLAKNVKLSILAKGTPGFSGADLANMVNEAALLAAKRSRKSVQMTDLEEAKDKVIMGAERRSLVITEDEKKTTAYHESGHVLVSKLIPGSDPVHKVTIIPRGRALGVTSFLPIDEKHNYTKTYCQGIMAHMLGGRAAEMVVFNEQSTGAGNDLERATEMSRKMVCEWGMSDELGPVTFGKKNEEIFLGREISQHRDYSEATAVLIDKEVKKFILDADKLAHKLINDNIDMLHTLAAALLEREMLDGEELDILFAGKSLKPKKKAAAKPKKSVKRVKPKSSGKTD